MKHDTKKSLAHTRKLMPMENDEDDALTVARHSPCGSASVVASLVKDERRISRGRLKTSSHSHSRHVEPRPLWRPLAPDTARRFRFPGRNRGMFLSLTKKTSSSSSMASGTSSMMRGGPSTSWLYDLCKVTVPSFFHRSFSRTERVSPGGKTLWQRFHRIF